MIILPCASLYPHILHAFTLLHLAEGELLDWTSFRDASVYGWQPQSLGRRATRLLILQSPSLAGIVRLQCVCVWCLSDCVVIGSCSAVWDSAGWRLHVNPSFLSVGCFLSSCSGLQRLVTEMQQLNNFETFQTLGRWVLDCYITAAWFSAED